MISARKTYGRSKSDRPGKKGQPAFGVGAHDGIQYHFFAGDKFFSVRVVETDTHKHQSAWLYDRRAREVLNIDSARALKQGRGDQLDISGPRFRIRADQTGGEIGVLDAKQRPSFEIAFRTPISFHWDFPGGPVIHQPLIKAEIAYRGETLRAVGYSKRYWYDDPIGYWSWRFIQGSFGRSMLWTAEANFDLVKYDYFKIVRPSGKLEQAANRDSMHRQEYGRAIVGRTTYEIDLQELGRWETRMHTRLLDTKLRQRFCKMTLRRGDKVETGYALNEIACGTAW
ncbi:MAG: hypothetical protein FJX35_16160 [Alphaproteobacteria bacterium]|nr:hypothetical protein [Alphaproteobacteria bacterium]